MIYDEKLSYIFHTIEQAMPGLSQIFLFWSRARWDHKQCSDFDIGIQSEKTLSRKDSEFLKDLFSDFPYCVDIVDFGSVSKEFIAEAMKDTIPYKQHTSSTTPLLTHKN